MSRSDWRARKANVGSGHPAHTMRDDHDYGGMPPPPSPLLCDAVSPVNSMAANSDSAFEGTARGHFKPAVDSHFAVLSQILKDKVLASPACAASSPLLRDDAVSPMLFGSHEASPRAYSPHEQRMISRLYSGAPAPLLAFHSELETMRQSTADESLDTRHVFAESMIITDIMSALEQQSGSALNHIEQQQGSALHHIAH